MRILPLILIFGGLTERLCGQEPAPFFRLESKFLELQESVRTLTVELEFKSLIVQGEFGIDIPATDTLLSDHVKFIADLDNHWVKIEREGEVLDEEGGVQMRHTIDYFDGSRHVRSVVGADPAEIDFMEMDKGSVPSWPAEYSFVFLAAGIYPSSFQNGFSGGLKGPESHDNWKVVVLSSPLGGRNCDVVRSPEVGKRSIFAEYWVDSEDGQLARLDQHRSGRVAQSTTISYATNRELSGWEVRSFRKDGTPRGTWKVDVLALQLNQAYDQSFFQLDMKPGMRVYDGNKAGDSAYYFVADDGKKVPLDKQVSVTRTKSSIWVWLALTAATLSVASAAIIRFRRQFVA